MQSRSFFKSRPVQSLGLFGVIAVALHGTSSFASDAESTESSLREDLAHYLRPSEIPAPADNQITPERVALGKALFFDPRLSGSNSISCATCHSPGLGWSDAQPTAVGVGTKHLGRNSPTILNSAYNSTQFWDGRAATLEEQALGPIADPGEMAQDLSQLVDKLSRIKGYHPLFEAAYPGESISEQTMAKALATFERTIVSTEAPFDRWVKGDPTAMSDAAVRGFHLYEGKANCVACHSGFNFTDNSFHNLGVRPFDEDPGRYKVKPVAILKGAFKTPTLRDVELTAPYMHDGSVKTLRDVVSFYNGGGKIKENLSPEIRPLNLSDQEVDDLVAFMRALTGEPRSVTMPRLPVE
jgi:cytochrome c peroxidase